MDMVSVCLSGIPPGCMKNGHPSMVCSLWMSAGLLQNKVMGFDTQGRGSGPSRLQQVSVSIWKSTFFARMPQSMDLVCKKHADMLGLSCSESTLFYPVPIQWIPSSARILSWLTQRIVWKISSRDIHKATICLPTIPFKRFSPI
jgi:hypothetical protein